MRRITLGLALLIAAPLAFSGCGGPKNTVWVTGKLLKGGAMYTPPQGQKVGVTLVALEVRDKSGKTVASNEPYAAELNPADGTFVVPGAQREGIPPGKYRVAVVRKMTAESLAAASPSRGKTAVDRETDLFKDRFGIETSPIVREVKTSGELVVDLDQPAG